MTGRSYASPAGFKQALETRLRADAALTGRALGRQRQLVVFDRFLARIAVELGDRVIVKGGVVLELRLARARTTRNIDLRVIGDPATLEAQLRAAAARDLGDHLEFEVRADPIHPTIEGSVKFFVSGSIALFSRQCSKVLVISSNFSSRRLAYLRLIRLGAVRGVLSQPYSRRRAVKASITRSVSTPA